MLLYSCDDLFEVSDISDQEVMILAPKNEVTISNSSIINLSWESVEDAETYEIQLATPAFQDATQIVLDSVTDATSLEINLNSGDYQWRIRAINSGFATNYTTSAFSIE